MSSPRRFAALLPTLCMLCGGGAQADDLGRLFTSAAERARIDATRIGKQSPQNDTADGSGGGRVVVNGTLQGSDGKRLVWLNGAPVNPDAARDLTLLPDGRVRLTWRDGAKTLKPGQGVDPVSGEIFEHHTPVPVPDVKDTVAEAKPVVAPAAAAPAATADTSTTTAAATKPATESKAK